MTTDEAQANPDTVIGIMFVFSTPARVFFDFGFIRSFINSSFALHADRDLFSLKSKLVVTTSLREQIF